MNGLGGFRKPAAVTLALGALVMVTALTLAACGGGTTVTATPQASGGTGQVQPAERHGHLGDAIVLSDGGKGQLEATALGLKFMSNIATRDSTVSNVYGVKLKLRNVGSTPIHLAAVGADSVLFDAGGWRYFPPAPTPGTPSPKSISGIPATPAWAGSTSRRLWAGHPMASGYPMPSTSRRNRPTCRPKATRANGNGRRAGSSGVPGGSGGVTIQASV